MKKMNTNTRYQSRLFFGIKPKSRPHDIAWAISPGLELAQSVLNRPTIAFNMMQPVYHKADCKANYSVFKNSIFLSKDALYSSL